MLCKKEQLDTFDTTIIITNLFIFIASSLYFDNILMKVIFLFQHTLTIRFTFPS